MPLKKSQASVEFIIILAIMLVIFISFFGAVSTKKNNFEQKERQLKAKTIAEKLAVKINEVHMAGDGSSTELFMPHDNSTTVLLVKEGPFVEVIFKDGRYTFPILTDRVDSKEIEPGNFVIENKGGKIDIN